jgi:hypothetical protein
MGVGWWKDVGIEARVDAHAEGAAEGALYSIVRMMIVLSLASRKNSFK